MQTQYSSAVAIPDDYVFQFASGNCQGPESSRICFAARSSGLFYSRDCGQTWKPAYATLNTADILLTTSVVLAPDFEHDSTILAGLNGAILCSYDGGTKWRPGRVPSPPPAISALAISPNYAEDGTIFAGTNEDGVLVSQDRGRSWVTWNFGLLDLNILCLAVSPDFAADETLFAGTESGLFRSTNGGRAWREVSLPIGLDGVLSLALSPNFVRDGILFTGTENKGLLVSRNGGKSWQLLAETVSTAPVNQIVLSPTAPSREIIILHGGVLLASKDAGKTWKPWHAKRLRDCSITAVLAPHIPGGRILVGCEDGRILRI